MIITIVEDEPVIAQRIERMLKEILDKAITKIYLFNSFEEVHSHLITKPIDLLFLDLNLKGKDGFKLLEIAEASSFYTIIVSAYDEKAIQAFKYPVMSFIQKPFEKEDISNALDKLNHFKEKNDFSSQFLSTKMNSEIHLIEIKSIVYAKGAGMYSEIYLEDTKSELFHQNLEKLNLLLPSHFMRIHKSYIVNLFHVKKINSFAGSQYLLTLKNNLELPVSRQKYKEIKDYLSLT